MANALTLMKRMDVSTGKHGVVGVAIDGAIGFGASYLIGRAYHEKKDTWGKKVPAATAAIGKFGAVALSYFTGGHPGLLVGAVDAVGQAGLNAIGLELGLNHAREKTGMQAALVPAGTSVKKLAAGAPVSVGALGKAQPGRGLSWDQIEELASGH